MTEGHDIQPSGEQTDVQVDSRSTRLASQPDG
jgi:hypothetical protein